MSSLTLGFTSCAVSPPGSAPASGRCESEAESELEEDKPLVRMIPECSEAYRTFQNLAMHLKGHTCRLNHNIAVVSNRCPVCRSVLSSVKNARRHLQSNVEHGRRRELSTRPYSALVEPESLTRPLCTKTSFACF